MFKEGDSVIHRNFPNHIGTIFCILDGRAIVDYGNEHHTLPISFYWWQKINKNHHPYTNIFK
jgi:hypothetical protein